MLNLIPPEGRKQLRNEYLIRVFTVYAFLLSAVLITVAILLVPTYVLVSTQLDASEDKVDDSLAFETERKVTEAMVRESTAVTAQLWSGNAIVPFSAYIQAVRDAAGPDVQFLTFQLEEKDGAITSFQVQGIAKSRSALTQFIEAIERAPEFESASVPVSDLARDIDLPFAMSITVSTEN